MQPFKPTPIDQHWGMEIHERKVSTDYISNFQDEHILVGNTSLKTWQDLTEYPLQKAMSSKPSLAKKNATFTKLLKERGKVEEVVREDLVWRLELDNEWRIESCGNPNGTDPYLGLDNSEITIWMKSDGLKSGNRIAPVGATGYNLVIGGGDRVGGEPAGDGGFMYKAQLAPGSIGPYLPPEYLNRHQQWMVIDGS